MIIQNFDRMYQVICYLGGTEKTEEFLCREIGELAGKACTLVKITDSALAKNFMLFLEERIRGREFSDYQGSFQFEGAFYAVFSYSENQLLTEKLTGEFCSLAERAQIAKRLLEQLLLLNPHPYFGWNVLLPERITVSRSTDIYWRYHLENPQLAESIYMEDVRQRLKGVLEYLFAYEMEKKIYPRLEQYLDWLTQPKGQDYMEIYRGYMEIYEELTTQQREVQVPKTFVFRLWEHIRRGISVGKKVLMAAILLATIWYVLQSLQTDESREAGTNEIKQIGELVIE